MSFEPHTFEVIKLFRHGVILRDETFWVVGGVGDYKSEACTFDGTDFTCKRVEPSLYYYSQWPELFLVDLGQGSKKIFRKSDRLILTSCLDFCTQ